MINNYKVNFPVKELISAFLNKKRRELNFLKKTRYRYELASGRDCIYFILKDIEKKKGKGEVICPNYSCKAIPRAIIASGFRPVFVDIDKTLSLNLNKVKEAIGPNTKAIIFYHPWGFEHSKEIVKIAKKNKIPLIEDCAQAIGKDIGDWGGYSFFSFRTSKIISIGSGAIILSKEKIEIPIKKSSKLIQLIDFLDLFFRSKIKNYSKPRAIVERFEKIKSRKMGNFQRNLLIKELNKLEINLARRINNYKELKETVVKTKNFKNIQFDQLISPLYFPIIYSKKNEAIKLFKKEGINATGYYNYINSDYFVGKTFGKKNSSFFAKTLINLPLYEKLNKYELNKIKETIIKIDQILK